MKIQLRVLGISLSHTMSGAYALILEEVGGNRRIPLIIGDFEAQAIVLQIEKMQAPRPLTHELFAQFAELFNIQLREIYIYGFERGMFYTRIVCSNGVEEKTLEAR
ncbi:MAG: bifunctional nuclease family protein, partial [Prevotellaceae bacterium]|nr:bifunctional nuclease family protein [Prevotellaceae bacterium]